MITVITAVPGSGKTLYAIGLIDEANKAGRPVYQNIDGLQKDKFVNPSIIYDAPDDWRDTPDGSLVIYDECQQPHLYPATGQRGKVDDERLTAMEVHRHTGHDLIFITQAPTFVHHHVRKLAGSHIHFYRARGVKGAMRYEWSHICDSPNDREEQKRADSTLWKFPKQYYNFYKSATVHTHKFKMPAKGWRFLLIIFVIVGFLSYQYIKAGGFLNTLADTPIIPHTGERAEALAPPPPVGGANNETGIIESVAYQWTKTPPSLAVLGCVATKNACACYSDKGTPLSLELGACLSVARKPIPRNILGNQKE